MAVDEAPQRVPEAAWSSTKLPAVTAETLAGQGDESALDSRLRRIKAFSLKRRLIPAIARRAASLASLCAMHKIGPLVLGTGGSAFKASALRAR